MEEDEVEEMEEEQDEGEVRAQEVHYIIKPSFLYLFIQRQHKQHLEDLIINQQQVVEDEVEDEVVVQQVMEEDEVEEMEV